MENLPVTIMGIIAIVAALVFIRMVTGMLFRVVILIVLVAFLYYLYTTGVHTMIMAPGAPESELIGTII